VTDPQHDPRFSNNPLVTNTPKVLFYAGVPISTPKGEVLGTLCVIDTKQRQFVSQQELSALNNLARQVMAHMEISKSLTELEDCQTQLNLLTQQQTAECKEDELTHLKNRRGFEEVLAIEWERTFRHSNSLSLLLLNLDQFSRFRDEFGHAAGNEVLQKIAGLISKDARNLDLIAHFCNDDFAILLPETDSKGALIIAERIRKRIEVEHWPHRPLTASIGVSSYNGMQINEESLLSDAQQQLVQAKKAGHNCIRFID
jgi:diguanylate cyclase (GGDEF)-like protein